ncbi:hypothetical protein F5X68DRAFT_188204 [Plectosphaerella plurivora]|uniref:Uncharacterized protein n=1 Tax=Plectosphaerella plurivora TaxID=936078 RepID=A0A9P8VI87_9PEZI|nr:hypothetical protein F5X68DRAFT_188204 [Plectosphaerella plurivora]
MKTAGAIIAILAAATGSSAAAIKTQPEARQFGLGLIGGEAISFAQDVIEDARSSASERYRGRRLEEDTGSNACTTAACRSCKNSSLTIAIAEVMGCGLAALVTTIPATLVSGPVGFALEVSGFTLCEAAAVAEYNRSLISCRAN